MFIKILFVLLLPFCLTLFVKAQEPTHKDLRYDEDFDRSVMDLWLPEGQKSRPIILFFHGGAFKMGDKTMIPFRGDFVGLVRKNIAIASVGYPLLGDKGKKDQIRGNEYHKILEQTVKAVEFLKKNAEKYNLDTNRMVVSGSSAGALISEYLTYKEKLGISVCVAIEQPYEVKSVIEEIDQGEAPLILYTWSGTSDLVHSPTYAQQLDAHCKKVGVPSFLYGSKESGLPQIPAGTSFINHLLSIITKVWSDA